MKKRNSNDKPGLRTEDFIAPFLLAGEHPEFDSDAGGHVQCMGNDTLAAVARGELDLNAVAVLNLAARGMSPEGQWVGFEKAGKLAKRILDRKYRG